VNTVRNLVADLVAKRLWPVAALLVVALVAVPVLLKGSAEEPPLPQVQAPGESGPIVSVAGERPRGGSGPIGRNPFNQRRLSTGSGSTATASASAAPDGGQPTSLGRGGDNAWPGAGGGDAGAANAIDRGVDFPGLGDVGVVPVDGGTTPAPKKPAAKSDEKATWHVDIRFGRDGKMTARNDVPRLSPLPDRENPFFIYLGVQADGKTALFLVSSDATATGDGRCLPNPQNCERVEMRAGDTQYFDVVTPGGEAVQYQLEVTRVRRGSAPSPTAAAAVRSRESGDGRQVLRKAVDTGQVEVSDLAYSRDLGLVVPSGRDQERSGALFGGFRVDLRFGNPDRLIKRYNLARLTPLPSVDEPSFMFLGVLRDGETALFLNPTEARATGDAVCEPSAERCQRLKLGAGQKAVIDAPTLSGATTEYHLTIDGISPVRAATAEQAAASRGRESKAGRVILRRLITEVGSLVEDLSFSGGRGVIEPAK
jgi:hypothetical protein